MAEDTLSKKNALHESMSTNMLQLDSMLALAYGNGPEEGLNNMTHNHRDNYMWACHHKLQAIRAAYEALMDIEHEDRFGQRSARVA